MHTEVLPAPDIDSGTSAITRAAAIIRTGGLVAIPTETVYGLAANALDPAAVDRIYSAKGRPADNPLIVHISDIKDLDNLCTSVPPAARELAKRFWPGPLTMVLPRRPGILDGVTRGLDTVAIRVPDHPVALAIIKAAGVPVAAPSANISGSPSPTKAEHVVADLDGRIDAIVDSGPCRVGLESTVLDLSVSPPCLLRPGGVSRREIETAIGEKITVSNGEADIPRSPGVKYRHYSPKARVVTVLGRSEFAVSRVNSESGEFDGRCAALCFDGETGYDPNIFLRAIGSEDDPESIARRLFSELRELDAQGYDLIFVRSPRGEGIVAALQDRLRRASEKFIEE